METATGLLFALAALVALGMLAAWLWSRRGAKVQKALAEAKQSTAQGQETAAALDQVQKQIALNTAKDAVITAGMIAAAGEEAARQRLLAKQEQDSVDADLLRRGLIVPDKPK